MKNYSHYELEQYRLCPDNNEELPVAKTNKNNLTKADHTEPTSE